MSAFQKACFSAARKFYMKMHDFEAVAVSNGLHSNHVRQFYEHMWLNGQM